MQNMSKLEIGTIITLITTIIAATLFIGNLHGRVSALEKDKDFKSITDKKKEALTEFNSSITKAENELSKSIATKKTETLSEIQSSINDAKRKLNDALKNRLNEINKKSEQNLIAIKNEIQVML